MTRALLVSVRFHDGRYHGAGNWPPSPARLFQALVAAAALPRLDDAKRSALKWLETLSAPTIAAPAAYSGQNVNLFVPNNDLDAKGGDIRRIAEIRSATKRIRPRLFDATEPLLYIWRFDGDESHADCICNIVNGLYQLGRGVDMAWAIGDVLDEAKAEEYLISYPGSIYQPSKGGNDLTLDCPDDGSLASLEYRHKANAHRFRQINETTQFANTPKPRFRTVAYNSPTTHLLFELRRTTAPGTPFATWPLKGAAALVQIIRGSVDQQGIPQSGATRKLWDALPSKQGEIGRVFIGRNATDADKAQRINIIPLPSIGHTHADRCIRRVLVNVPPDCPIRADDIAWALSDSSIASHGIDVRTGEITRGDYWAEQLVSASDNSMLARYGVPEGHAARLWRSVTPLALPEGTKRRRIDYPNKHEEANGSQGHVEERRYACHAVIQALRHVGRREQVVGLRVQREPFHANGERAEAFADGTRFSKHQLWHVEIEFSQAISGPLILGNGRYGGLGLMVPVRQVEGVLAFNIVDGLAVDAEPLPLARALRRAVMARVQSEIGIRKKLPTFFTGHEDDGSTARRGGHTHLAFVPDLARKRLLVIAPHVIEHREPSKEECKYLGTLTQALAGLSELRAGRAGKLDLERIEVLEDEDPLFSASNTWLAATPYSRTRHIKRNSHDSWRDDILKEVRRRQLPVPQAVEMEGSDLLVRFKVAVPGPLLLGKTLHFGGGLFASATEERP